MGNERIVSFVFVKKNVLNDGIVCINLNLTSAFNQGEQNLKSIKIRSIAIFLIHSYMHQVISYYPCMV